MSRQTDRSTVKLIIMANQIAAAFRMEGRDVAVAEVTNHLKLYWTSKMQCELATYIATNGAGLDPLAIAALHRLVPPSADAGGSLSASGVDRTV